MASPVIVPARDAVVALLNASGVLASITPVVATAAYDTQAGLESLAGGRVLVVPRGMVTELETHDREASRGPVIDVAIQYRGKTMTTSELDPYLTLAEAIDNLLLGVTLSTGAVCTEIEWPEGSFVPEHVAIDSLFTCILACTFEVVS